MAIPYMRQSDVHMRLDSTLCLYKGLPVYVAVNENFDSNVIQVRDYMKHHNGVKCDWETINVGDDDFNVTDIELGYVNLNDRTTYCTRIPCRKQKQGLTHSSIRVSDKDISLDEVFYSQGLCDTIINKFPSKEEAIDSVVNRGRKQMAFSRNFSVNKISSRMITLDFRGRSVALYSIKNGTFSAIPDLKDYSLIMKYANRYNINL